MENSEDWLRRARALPDGCRFLEIDTRPKTLRNRAENAWLKTLFGDFKVGPKSESLQATRPTRALDMLCSEALEAAPYGGCDGAPTHATPYEDFERGAFRSPLNNTRR